MARTKTVAKKVEKKNTAKTVNVVKAEAAPKSVEEVKAPSETVEVAAEKAETGNKEAAEVKPAKAAKVAKAAKSAVEKATRATKAAKAPSQTVVLQVNGREDLSMSSLIDRVKDAYAAEGHSVDLIKDIEVYIKLNENMAYYVIDGYASGISLY